MVFDSTLSIVEFAINTGFMIISLLILYVFLRRFEGNIDYKRPNILGFILMSLGLSFHILGNLTSTLLFGTEIYMGGLNHLIMSFIAFSVVLFILGTAFILYHIVSEDNKLYVKIFAYLFGFFGIIDTLYHLLFFIRDDNIPIFGQDPRDIELIFILIEMISLTVIYFFMLLQSRKSPSKVVSVRYQLLALTALGFVLVIVLDSLLRINLVNLTLENFLTFVLFFILHVITVGALYLLVLFPPRFQKLLGLDHVPS